MNVITAGIPGEQIADYAWIKRGRKYWNLWVGNPFCCTLHKITITPDVTREMIVEDVRTHQAEERIRFAGLFPNQTWQEFQPSDTTGNKLP